MPNNTIHVISLPHRLDRREHLIAEFKEHGITDYKIWDGIINELPFVGISKAHKQIVQFAKDSNLPNIIIAEDDLQFSDYGAFHYFIENIPEAYSLYLSSIYWGEIQSDNTVNDFSSLTLYSINNTYYDTFLATAENQHIDRGQANRGKFIVSNPFICKQIEGYSDNVKRVVSYNREYLSGRLFYTRSVAENNALIAASL